MFLIVMVYARVMSSILISSMVTLPILISLCAALLSLLSSTSCAGVTAAAGELAKDEKYLAAVEKAGADFIPLVVETFGVWTPFALRTLYIIANQVVVFHPY